MNLFTGMLPDGTHLLVTVWPDGTAEAATRLDAWSTWSAPTALFREQVRA